MMVDLRAPLVDLPFWPLFLGEDEAARYLGASTSFPPRSPQVYGRLQSGAAAKVAA